MLVREEENAEETTLGELMVYTAIVVAGITFWAYAAVGFWVVNGEWITAAWRAL